MPKPSGAGRKLLVLRDYLLEQSDENHPISTAKLMEVLEQEGISVGRKTIYRDMELLQEHGFDVQHQRRTNGGWFIGERDFELPELKLLVDAVQSSRFITRKKSRILIKKLEGLTSSGQAKQLQRQVYVDGRVKSSNEEIYYVIDQLHAAIAERRVVRFKYFRYTVSKERDYRRGGAFYTVSPYGLIWADENYYLIGWDHLHQGELRHYRVDRMEHLILTELPRQGDENCEKFDLAEYGQKHFHMFSGEEAFLRLRCENELVNVILDRFGQDTILIPDGDSHFTVTVRAVVSQQFFGWLFGLGPKVTLVGPEDLVNSYQERLNTALQKLDIGRSWAKKQREREADTLLAMEQPKEPTREEEKQALRDRRWL